MFFMSIFFMSMSFMPIFFMSMFFMPIFFMSMFFMFIFFISMFFHVLLRFHVLHVHFFVGFAVHDHFLLFNHNRFCAYCYSCQRYSIKDCHKNSQYLFHSPR